jgi:hypothetical protein
LVLILLIEFGKQLNTLPNVNHLHETVATDMFCCDMEANDDRIYGHGGTTMIQLCCGTESLITAGYHMK